MIIAEIGGNHGGSLAKALELIDLAADCGVDYVKFQTYKAENLVHPSLKALPQAKGHDRQYTRFKELEFSDNQWDAIIKYCIYKQVGFLTTCFDEESLEKYAPRMDLIKIASGDLTYDRLIRKANEYGKPIILSTGMATYREIDLASKLVTRGNLTLMQCVSSYPTRDEDANLGVIPKLATLCPRIGYSDHTKGITACLAAYAMGAKTLEKHFTDRPYLDYGDHSLSASPEQMRRLVKQCSRIDAMMGDRKPVEAEYDMRTQMRRGTYAAREIEQGAPITEDDIIYLRPETPRTKIIGKRATKPHKYLDIING